MTFSAEAFNQQLTLLTDPAQGIVESTHIPDVFAIQERPFAVKEGTSPLVIVTGPSGAGKGSLIDYMMAENASFTHVKTACTRDRRPNEAEDERTWMRKKRVGESEAEYHANLIQEYDLVEHSAHNGGLYGLPRNNLLAISPELTPVLDTDTDGVASLTISLVGEYSLLSVMVCPESGEQLEARMRAIGRHTDSRMESAQMYLNKAPETANYVLLNRHGSLPQEAIRESGQKLLGLLGHVGCITPTATR